VSNILLLTNGREPPAEILPSLSLLPHAVRVVPAAAEYVHDATPAPDAVLVDGRRDLVGIRHVLRVLRATGNQVPVIVIVTDGGWAAVAADWGVADLLLHTAGPAEVEARLRLAIGRSSPPPSDHLPDEIRSSGLVINEATYTARMNGRVLDLTFKEFELLKFLAQHPGRVFTRAQLLQEVWGYDYFGGTRTVDVHVRRLRAKLGPDNEALIGTVRNVGYRFVPVKGVAPSPEVVDAREQDGPQVAGSQSAVGSQPGVDGRPAVGSQPAVGDHPAVVDQPAVGSQPAVGDHPGVDGRPAVVDHPAAGSQPAATRSAGDSGAPDNQPSGARADW
jgi:DNA-binding response OmpR family regulator